MHLHNKSQSIKYIDDMFNSDFQPSIDDTECIESKEI